eukprot:10426435-Alexandrium_andersonii.AAC.1
MPPLGWGHQDAQHVDAVDLVELDHALGLLVHAPAAVDAEVDVVARLGQGAHRQEGPLHGRHLESGAAPVLLLGAEAQLHLPEVGDAAAVRRQVA